MTEIERIAEVENYIHDVLNMPLLSFAHLYAMVILHFDIPDEEAKKIVWECILEKARLGYTRPAEPSPSVARIMSEDGQSGMATGANIPSEPDDPDWAGARHLNLKDKPEPNPTSLDELKVQPAEPSQNRVKAVAKIINDWWNHPSTPVEEIARSILKLCQPELKVLENIKTQTMNAKRNASEIYNAHRALKPRDKQAKNYYDGYDSAMQDLINYLVSYNQKQIKGE